MLGSKPNMVQPKGHAVDCESFFLGLYLHFAIEHSVQVEIGLLNVIVQHNRRALLENEQFKKVFDNSMGNSHGGLGAMFLVLRAKSAKPYFRFWFGRV
jgi:hypothetical protein